MTKEVRRRSGTGAQHTTFTGAPAEVTVDTTDNRLVVHDGVTAGGHPVAKESEITSATVGIATKLPKDGSEAMSGNLDLDGNNLVDVGNINGGPLGGFRNKIINGDFDIWQRATSQTLNDYGSVDRWRVASSGSTKTFSQQTFTLGQTDVIGNPTYYSRNVISSVAGAGNFAILSQRIEGVKTLSGKTATLTFYAKADAAKNMAVELSQSFGTSGSPSSDVNGIGAQLVALTTSWQKFSVTITIPSISGKTLGSDGNDSLQVFFWFDAGSTYNSRTASLGQQSGTFDIAHVSLVEGDATLEDDPFETRHIQQELELCMRYFENGEYNIFGVNYVTNAAYFYNSTQFKVRKRATPTISISADTSFLFGGILTNQISVSQFSHYAQGTTTAAGTGYYAMTGWSADAEL